jgi:hypothetical protein
MVVRFEFEAVCCMSHSQMSDISTKVINKNLDEKESKERKIAYHNECYVL